MSSLLIIFLGLASHSCQEKVLPRLNLIQEEPFGSKYKLPCVVIYSDTRDSLALRGKIKYRGGISSQYHKHSFSLELDKKRSIAKLPRDDDWIINANYIDKTFMRHKISYDLFREMNTKNIAARSGFANLSINNKYEGLYVVMQEINASMIGLNKRDTMAMLFKDPPIFYQKSLVDVQDSSNYYQQKYPKLAQADKTDYIEQFKDFLFNSNDLDFARHVADWVDLENVVDWHINLLFSNNSDGIMKNFYLYKLNAHTPFRFAIWDCDHSIGRDGDNERNLMQRTLNCNRSILLKRLSSIPELGYLVKLKKRWFELRKKNILSLKNFEHHIQKIHRSIATELLENSQRWPYDAKWYYDNDDYQKELNLMREFVKIRVKQLDEYFCSL